MEYTPKYLLRSWSEAKRKYDYATSDSLEEIKTLMDTDIALKKKEVRLFSVEEIKLDEKKQN